MIITGRDTDIYPYIKYYFLTI